MRQWEEDSKTEETARAIREVGFSLDVTAILSAKCLRTHCARPWDGREQALGRSQGGRGSEGGTTRIEVKRITQPSSLLPLPHP